MNNTEKMLLEASNIGKTFTLEQKKIEVLRNLDFSVPEKASIAIVGASGQGKSTLLQILGTLDAPTEGKVLLDGKDVFSLKEQELNEMRNRLLGFVFQAHYLLPEFTALENVMMPGFIQGYSRQKAKEAASELLEWVGLRERTQHRPGELSGGERQRVALCRALVLKPRLLLADEPTGNLDQHTGAEIHQLLEEVNQKWGTAIVLVTHNMQLAKQMQKCYLLKDGKLQEKVDE